MLPLFRVFLTFFGFLWLPMALLAFHPSLDDIQPARPKQKPSAKELQHREALKLFGRAMRHQKRNELVEAMRTLEKALKLDPESVEIRKALIPLYTALARNEEALATCKAALDQDPDQFEIWYRYAQQLHAMARNLDARAALERALRCKSVQSEMAKQVVLLDELALMYEEAKLYGKAEETFRREVALLEDPRLPINKGPIRSEELTVQLAETWERIGRLALKQKKPDRALTAFEKARAKDKERPLRFYLHLAEVFAAQKKSEKALTLLDRYLARQPQELDGYELKVKLLKDEKGVSEAIRSLRLHARIDRHNMPLQLLLARELQHANQFREAKQLYEHLKSTSPSEEVFEGLVSLYKKQDRNGLDSIISLLNESVIGSTQRQGPPGPAPSRSASHARFMLSVLRKDRALVRRILPVAHRRFLSNDRMASRTRAILGELALTTRQFDISEALFRSCLDRDGRARRDVTTRDFSDFEQEIYRGLISVLRYQRKSQAVIDVCKQGIRHAKITNQVVFHLNMSQAWIDLDRPKEALKAAQKAVDLSSDLNRLLCNRNYARILSQTGRHKEAIAFCEKLLKEFKEEKDIRSIRYTLSGLYSAAGKKEKSAEQLQAILEVDPNDATANNDLGYMWADQNRNLNKAERMIRKAIRLDREERNSGLRIDVDSDLDNAAFVDSLGWVLFRKGRFKEAKQELEKAVRLPDGEHDPVLHDHLGDVYSRMGESQKAIELWEKALSLYKNGWRKDTEGRSSDIREKIKLMKQALSSCP